MTREWLYIDAIIYIKKKNQEKEVEMRKARFTPYIYLYTSNMYMNIVV